MARAAANQSAGLAFPLSSNSELLAAYSLIIFLWSPSAVWTLLIAKCSVSESHSVFFPLSAALCSDWIKSLWKRMDPVTLILPAAATLNCELLHYQTRTVTEMTLLSPRTTFSALELNNKEGLLTEDAPCALLFLSLGPHLVFASFMLQRSGYKHIKNSNWRNDWTFSPTEDGGGVSWRQDSVCVWGGGVKSRWREEGGRGSLGLGGGGVMVVWGLRAVVGYASATCLAWHLLLLDSRMLDRESGWACPASLWSKSGVSVALCCILLSP